MPKGGKSVRPFGHPTKAKLFFSSFFCFLFLSSSPTACTELTRLHTSRVIIELSDLDIHHHHSKWLHLLRLLLATIHNTMQRIHIHGIAKWNITIFSWRSEKEKENLISFRLKFWIQCLKIKEKLPRFFLAFDLQIQDRISWIRDYETFGAYIATWWTIRTKPLIPTIIGSR